MVKLTEQIAICARTGYAFKLIRIPTFYEYIQNVDLFIHLENILCWPKMDKATSTKGCSFR